MVYTIEMLRARPTGEAAKLHLTPSGLRRIGLLLFRGPRYSIGDRTTMIYTLQILRACPALSLTPGNLIIVDMEEPPSTLVARPFPVNIDALPILLEDGSAELLTPQSSVAEFAAAVGSTSGPPSPRPPSAPVAPPRSPRVRRFRRLK